MTAKLPSINRAPATPLFGLAVSYPSPGALEHIGPDRDWIWLSAQLGDLSFRGAVDLVRGADPIRRRSPATGAPHADRA